MRAWNPAPRPLAWRAGAIAAIALGLGLLWAGPALASQKTYTVATTSSVWAGGADQAVSLSIANTSRTPQSLGSANLTLPAGLTPLAGTASVTGAKHGATAALSGSVLQLRDLKLPRGATATAGVRVRVTLCTPAQLTVGTAAKQSNDFNGSGNDFTLSGAPPKVTVAGSCTLRFVDQPASAQRATDITNDVYRPFSGSPPGDPVTVEVLDGSGAARVTWWSAAVGLGLAANPGSATLSGTTSVTPVAGLATFKNPASATPGPRIGTSAAGYRLSASSAGIAAASPPSASLDIVDVGKWCTAGQPCAGSTSASKSTANVSASASANDILSLSLGATGVPAPLCAGYTTSTDTLDFDITTLGGASTGGQRTIVFTLLSRYVTKPAYKYDACFQSTLPFVTKSGAPAVVSGGYYTGLLPECSKKWPTAPCEVRTDRTHSGDIVMTLIAPAADPRARF